MDLKDFFNKIRNSNAGSNIPQIVIESFNIKFNEPLNTEWSKTEGQFEAVFYKDELEHIARYNSKGKLVSLKINLPLSSLPEHILETAKLHGELMNAIAIHKAEEVIYELIVRDEKLIRYSLLLYPNGGVSEKQKL